MIEHLSFARQFAAVAALSLVCIDGSAVAGSQEAPSTSVAGSTDDSAAKINAHETASLDADAPLPPYVVLGHRVLRQELRVSDAAWTLGAGGFVIFWERSNARWRPIDVQQISDAASLSIDGSHVLVHATDGTTQRIASLATDQASAASDTQSPGDKQNIPVVDAPDDCVGERPGEQLEVPCASSAAAVHGPESMRVSVRTLRDILVADHGYYFVFPDGWYAFNTNLEHASRSNTAAPSNAADTAATVVQSDVAARRVTSGRVTSDSAARIWVEGQVVASGVYNGNAHVALCVERASGVQIIDRNIATGDATLVFDTSLTTMHRPVTTCPQRAEYHSGQLRLSYTDHIVRWSLESHALSEAAVHTTLNNALHTELRARASVSRRCAYQAWDVDLWTSIGRDDARFTEETPLRRGLCAESATALTWSALDEHSDGSAIIFSGSFGSFVLMIDAKTLHIHTLQTDIRLSTHAELRRLKDGQWLFVDDTTGTAHTIDAAGKVLRTERLVLIDNRIWRHVGGGVLESTDGHQLLATDAGIILDGVGIGSVVSRAVTSDMRRVRERPSLLASLLERLGSHASAAEPVHSNAAR